MKTWRFLTSDAGSGLVLAGAAILAVVMANSSMAAAYAEATGALIFLPGLGERSLADWIKEGPMALFFLAVGLEIKREIRHGELAHWRRAMLPVAAAAGGMIAPALIYLAINLQAGGHVGGWAVPVATDVAFALAVLAVAVPRAHPNLRLFLLTLAVVDDLGAVALIALLYSHGAAAMPLCAIALVLGVTALFGRWRKVPGGLFAVAFVIVLFLTLKAGVSTSLAGVATALVIPNDRLLSLHRRLAPWVALLVLPLFGLTSAGISFASLGAGAIVEPVSLGIAAGLVLGKPLGVFGGAVLARQLGIAARPNGLLWRDIAAVALLCGIGFTMSLYLAALAFPQVGTHAAQAKAGILLGSVIAGILGVSALRLTVRKRD